MNISFEKKVALVTGAGSGLGLATAKAFAESGASVVLADANEKAVRSAAEELSAQGHKTLAIKCDVADDAQVEAMIERIVATFGRLDAAYNNAGVQNIIAEAADATREDLKMARSEMGTLIARNHDEIDQLRRLGERDYVEFTITGKNKPQKVSNVTVELKGVNEKRNQFSVAMTVEDKRFEKKNRAMNEPIFFYVSGTHIPEEVVIKKVSKDTISGYVSVPKANSQTASNATSKSGN